MPKKILAIRLTAMAVSLLGSIITLHYGLLVNQSDMAAYAKVKCRRHRGLLGLFLPRTCRSGSLNNSPICSIWPSDEVPDIGVVFSTSPTFIWKVATEYEHGNPEQKIIERQQISYIQITENSSGLEVTGDDLDQAFFFRQDFPLDMQSTPSNDSLNEHADDPDMKGVFRTYKELDNRNISDSWNAIANSYKTDWEIQSFTPDLELVPGKFYSYTIEIAVETGNSVYYKSEDSIFGVASHTELREG